MLSEKKSSRIQNYIPSTVVSRFNINKKRNKTYIWGKGRLPLKMYVSNDNGWVAFLCFPNLQQCDSLTFIIERKSLITLNK